MRRGIVFTVNALIAILAFSVTGTGQAPARREPTSVPAPDGWSQCPRCQNNKDRAEANAKYKVEGHAFNPRDLSGVWGWAGVAGAFRNPPPMTEWGKQQHATTVGAKNAAGEILHS